MAGFDTTTIIAYVVGIILIYVIGRMLVMPIRLVLKLVYNAVVGGAMLWAFNYIGAFFGFTLALNPITALVAGFLGVPGVILLILFKIFIK